MSQRALALTDEERKRTRRASELALLGAAAVSELIAGLDDPSWAVRRATIAALASLGEPAVVPLCELLASRRDSEGRVAAAVDALVGSRGHVDHAVLGILAESKINAVVCDAAQILGRRQSSAGVAKLALLTTDPDDNVALSAIEALGRIGDEAALTPIIAAAESRSFFRTFPAIDVLGRSGNPRAVKPLLGMLDEAHYAAEAARALGRVGDPSTVPALAALLGRASDALVRVAASAICEIDDRHTARFGANDATETALKRADLFSASRRLVQCMNRADPGEQAALGRLLGWIGGEEVVVALVDMLAGEPNGARVAAAALDRLGSAAEAQLLASLRTGESDQRLMILPLLGRKTTAAEPISECLLDPSPAVRAFACDALARIGEPSVVSRLFALLGDPDARVAQSAVAAIQSLGSAETERLALDAGRSSDARVRRAGMRIIAYFGYESGLDLLVGGMDDEDERIRDAAIFGLPYLEDPRALEALLRAAKHTSARTRAASMRALGQAPRGPRTIAALRLGLHDADPWVRYFSCQALSRLKDEDSAASIASLLGDPAGQVRVAVVEALAQLRGTGALDALHGAAQGSDPDVQRAALLGLGAVKSASSLPVLRAALQSADSATRLVALSALAEFSAEGVTRDLAASISDPDEGVRNAAVALLGSRRTPEASHVLAAALTNRAMRDRIVDVLSQPVEGRIEALAEALRNGTSETTPLVVSALARMRRTEADVALMDAFSSPDAALRRTVAPALMAMGPGPARAMLARAAVEDTDEEVRQISAAATEN